MKGKINVATIDLKDALRLGLEARQTPLSTAIEPGFVDFIYDNRLRPMLAKGTYKTNMVLEERITFMLELLAFSSYAKLDKYDVDTWEHSPSIVLGGRTLTPDFFVPKSGRYVEIYSPAQGHDHANLDFLTELERKTIGSTITKKSQKYSGLKIDIVTHISTQEFPSDYAKTIKAIPLLTDQRFLLFQGDSEVQI